MINGDCKRKNRNGGMSFRTVWIWFWLLPNVGRDFNRCATDDGIDSTCKNVAHYSRVVFSQVIDVGKTRYSHRNHQIFSKFDWIRNLFCVMRLGDRGLHNVQLGYMYRSYTYIAR